MENPDATASYAVTSNGVAFLGIDRKLYHVLFGEGIVELGYPISNLLEELNPASAFVRSSGSVICVGDAKHAYQWTNADGWEMAATPVH